MIFRDWEEYDLFQDKELVTNGNFDSNFDGWNSARSGASSLSYGDGFLIISPTSTSTFGASSELNEPLVSGQTYRVKCNIRGNRDGMAIRLRVDSSQSLSSAIAQWDTTTSYLTVDDVFTCPSDGVFYVGTIITGASPGDWIELDNVSIQPA